jgi:hypothetical protein
MGAWMGAVAGAPVATFEAAMGAWTGAAADASAVDAPAADAPAATSEAPTMGISFFSIVGVFSLGFLRREVEKMMGQERRLQ